ncbi:MAG: hypothetical protein IID08_09680 [Candidatus Hydrogenedentes bacterium]|nr:hypothetical protein [Candidatus Hydrogenedentota bacterium]
MRIQPVEKPKGIVIGLVYRSSSRQLGKVITPLTVVYARIPAPDALN